MGILKPKMSSSIITNFGCGGSCWYCAWNKHPLKNVKGPYDFDKIEKFLTGVPKVGISGGGDPLYNYDSQWWEQLFDVCSKFDIEISVHTRMPMVIRNLWERFSKIVISTDKVGDLPDLKDIPNVRLAHTITGTTLTEDIIDYVDLAEEHNCELTFRELVGFDDYNKFWQFEQEFGDRAVFLPSGDYNRYLMPDNNVHSHFDCS